MSTLTTVDRAVVARAVARARRGHLPAAVFPPLEPNPRGHLRPCVYCGDLTAAAWACYKHSDLPALDPDLGARAGA